MKSTTRFDTLLPSALIIFHSNLYRCLFSPFARYYLWCKIVNWFVLAMSCSVQTFRFYLLKRFIFPLPASRKEHNTQSSYNESLSIHLQEEIMAAHILVGHVVLAPKKVNRIVFNLYAFTVVLLHWYLALLALRVGHMVCRLMSFMILSLDYHELVGVNVSLATIELFSVLYSTFI